MKTVFADTGYWIALLNPQDGLHDRARTASAQLGITRVVTSEMVLAELLNDFASRGTALRRGAALLAERLQSDPNVKIVAQTSILFGQALALYAERHDKDWGLTDCASFSIMREHDIADALSHDRHFQQAGFRTLLRDD